MELGLVMWKFIFKVKIDGSNLMISLISQFKPWHLSYMILKYFFLAEEMKITIFRRFLNSKSMLIKG
jgi:hypothetical protein